MFTNPIQTIYALVQKGIAYEIYVPNIGTFVCLDYDAIGKKMPFHLFAIETLSPPPVWYPCLDGHTKTKDRDFPLWAPYVDGQNSPWGFGQPTVNLEYMIDVL